MATTVHARPLLGMTRRPRWEPGQFSFHPDTRVVCGCDPMTAADVDEWAMTACTWRGTAWWYGWVRMDLEGHPVPIEGWVLLPKVPGSVPFGGIDG